jgi:rfaE bifunctional protein kinase chain/domain
MKVLLVGDGIIDEYFYTEPMGRSAKANLVVNRYLSHEAFAGGAFAIANHLASFCGKVHLMSLIGEQDTREEFIRQSLKPNVEVELFSRTDTTTVIKKRYLQQHNNQKLFEVNYLHDAYINGGLEKKIIAHLKKQMPKYDIVLISDFGHGFITRDIVNCIKESGKKFGVNAQTNGANVGFNLITKYRDPFFVCLDEPEVRLATQERFMDVEEILPVIGKNINAQNMIVTRGRKGSVGIDRDGTINVTPIFSSKVVDTVGAGDAFFAYTFPCLASGMPMDAVSFVGNAVGALAVQILGNKKAVEKHELLEFIHAVLK